MLAWALGKLYYTAVLYDLEAPPIPSPADAGYLLFPLLALRRRLRARARPHPRRPDHALGRRRDRRARRSPPSAPRSSSRPCSTTSAASRSRSRPTLAYPLCDLVLLGVTVGALSATGWRLDRTWVLLAAGVATFWLADSLYLVESLHGTLQSPAPGSTSAGTLGLLLVAARRVAARRGPATRRA